MSDFRVIITGGCKRESEADYGTMEDIIERLDYDGFEIPHLVIIQGRCPTGIDSLAREVAEEYGTRMESIPADWKKHGRAAGPIRNQAMADASADMCLAFPSAGRSTGTWDMIRRACAAGIETRIYPVGQGGALAPGAAGIVINESSKWMGETMLSQFLACTDLRQPKQTGTHWIVWAKEASHDVA